MATKIQIARTEEPQLRPNAIQLEDGQPVINFNESEPGLYFKLRDDTLCKIGPTHVGPYPPNSSALGWPGNSIGEMWLDTSEAIAALHIWTGSEWTRDADVSVDTDQTITGTKTFTKIIKAEAGLDASGQDLFAESLNLTGTGKSIETSDGMPNNTLTTKGYVDSKAQSATLSSSLVAGTHLSGDNFNGTVDVIWSVQSTASNVTDTIVSRDSTGGFSASNLTLSSTFQIGDHLSGIEASSLGRVTLTSGVGSSIDAFVVSNTDGLSSVNQAVIKSNGDARFSGSVGVGNVVTPSSLLELKPASNSHQLQLTESNSDDGWRFHSDGLGGNLLNVSRYEGGVDSTKITVLSNGNVGIGANNPSTKLEINGNITANNITAFKDAINNSIDSAGTIAALRTVIKDALGFL